MNPKRKPDIYWSRYKGKIVTETGYAFNETGSVIWELCDGSRTIEDIAAILANRFDIAKETAEEDVEEFIEEAKNLELILL
ncbi:MAG: PqqD family protein [Theionarchaea archaeon]|nr:MAG: hypothetical protein AYK18_08680 [Theionarchaea archaeon DG-70]MBU7010941.1 PqqD family protein [Theionarchaea archaeon]